MVLASGESFNLECGLPCVRIKKEPPFDFGWYVAVAVNVHKFRPKHCAISYKKENTQKRLP